MIAVLYHLLCFFMCLRYFEAIHFRFIFVGIGYYCSFPNVDGLVSVQVVGNIGDLNRLTSE